MNTSRHSRLGLSRTRCDGLSCFEVGDPICYRLQITVIIVLQMAGTAYPTDLGSKHPFRGTGAKHVKLLIQNI